MFIILSGEVAMTGHYKHKQPGTLILCSMSIVILVSVLFLVLFISEPTIVLIVGTVLVVMLVVLFLFSSLTVEVDGEAVSLSFGLGVIRKKFFLKDVTSCQVVKNPWYYGWGIRKIPQGWLYNVSGFSAVELEMTDDKKNRIGTNEPEKLEEAVKAALGKEER